MALVVDKEAELVSIKKNGENKAEVYEKQIAAYTMRNAVENGYFQALTVEDILGQNQNAAGIFSEDDDDSSELQRRVFGRETSKEDSLNKIFMIKFPNSRLRSLGIIQQCRNLTICDLSCNYLERIDSLIHCQSLVKLDLHQNQVNK